MATSPQRPLRIGLLLDGYSQPRWVARVIESLAGSSALELSLIVLNDTPALPPQRFGRVRSWVRNRDYLLYAFYRRFDRWWFSVPNDPFAEVDLASSLATVPAVRVRPRMTKHCDYFEDADVHAIRSASLDVAIRFGFRILKGEALNIARYGVWSYHHGDNLVNRGGPAGFWEVMEDVDVTGHVVQRLTEELDAGQVLRRSFSPTNRISVAKNQSDLFWSSTLTLPRLLHDLQRNGAARVFDAGEREPWRGYSNRLYVVPKNGRMAKQTLTLARRYLAEKLHDAVEFDQWFVAYGVRASTPASRFAPDTSYYRFRKLVPPPDRFWADPFAVEHDGRRFIFVEELVYATNRGRISLFEIDASGRASGPTAVLERDYHLSYPFVFEWQGAHYMVPETHATGQVELFRAKRFPDQWEFERVLIPDVRAVDATLAEIGGRWWLFASVSPEPDIPWNDLWLFHADSPLGPWIPHDRNPVKSDARNARPAGRLFEWKGRLYRPAQDCSRRYGHSIVINEVTCIDPADFQEHEVSRISPSWSDRLLATHTINADGALTVIDGQAARRGRPR